MCPYKVLSREYGRLCSAVGSGDFRLEYIEGALTEARRVLLSRGFGVMCFEDEKSAREFADEWSWGDGLYVYECIGIDKMALPKKLAFTRTHTLADFNEMVKAVWPAGTAMYRAVKLTRRII